jgi:hypothetical protein
MKKVKTLTKNVTTYARPSIHALKVQTFEDMGHLLTVYPSIKGWYELRPVDEEGVMRTEFVQITDVLLA